MPTECENGEFPFSILLYSSIECHSLCVWMPSGFPLQYMGLGKSFSQTCSPPEDTSPLTNWVGKTENVTFIFKNDPVSLMNRLIGFNWEHYKFTIGVFFPWQCVIIHHGDGKIVANHLLFHCVNLIQTYECHKHKYHK